MKLFLFAVYMTGLFRENQLRNSQKYSNLHGSQTWINILEASIALKHHISNLYTRKGNFSKNLTHDNNKKYNVARNKHKNL